MTYNMGTAIIIANFVIHQDTIAKTLCVQRKAPKGCNGKCQLRKILQKKHNEEKNKTPLENTKRIVLEYSFIQPDNNSSNPILSVNYLYIKIRGIASYNTITKYYDIDIPPPIIC